MLLRSLASLARARCAGPFSLCLRLGSTKLVDFIFHNIRGTEVTGWAGFSSCSSVFASAAGKENVSAVSCCPQGAISFGCTTRGQLTFSVRFLLRLEHIRLEGRIRPCDIDTLCAQPQYEVASTNRCPAGGGRGPGIFSEKRPMQHAHHGHVRPGPCTASTGRSKPSHPLFWPFVQVSRYRLSELAGSLNGPHGRWKRFSSGHADFLRPDFIALTDL